MIYELMHKNVAVADIDLDSDGSLRKIVAVHRLDHFPFGTEPKDKKRDPTGIKRWWGNRRIPISRDDLAHFLGIFLQGQNETGSLLIACHALSLSDCYWIREKGERCLFSDVNFFENDYSYDLGDALFRRDVVAPSLMSPDATSEGNLKKRWKIIEGKRVLIKSGTNPHRYEVYNEVIASAVCAALNIRHVDYSLLDDDGETYCVCEDFLGYSQDFVTAYMIHEGGGKKNDESEYAFLIRRYEELGIKEAKKQIDQMLLVDFIIGNEDRHLNNFGLLRDANTLSFVGVAPIFDNGSCLGFDKEDRYLLNAIDTPWKPFATRTKMNQLDYIEALPLSSSESIFAVPSAVRTACESMAKHLPASRAQAIVSFVSRRIARIAERYGLVRKTDAPYLTAAQNRVLSYLRSRGGTADKLEEICLAAHVSRITALRSLSVLADLGLVRRVGSRKAGHWECVAP